MDRSLYINSVGLANIERAQAARANNLANASTPGFRADLARVTAREVVGDNLYASRVYGVNEGAGVDFAQGAHVSTGRDLDVAIAGEGFFAVLDAEGQEAYSRDGRFEIDNIGRLLDSRGQQVMGRGGPVALPPYESVLIGADGAITIRPEGQGPEALVQVDQLKLVNPETHNLYKAANGNLYGRDFAVFGVAEGVQVNSGFVESSNVNAINELTEILSLARQFELEVRMMKVAETNDEASSQLLRIG